MSGSEAFLFAEENERQVTTRYPWKIIIADDEDEVHNVTRMVLDSYTFEGRPLQLLSAHSGAEAKKVIHDNPDTAIILLDVVMEDENAGLDVVKWIREEEKNLHIRIILRTGQPGQAPEKTVIRDYDINDYREKTELTDQRLFTSITSSLRSYRDLRTIERNKKGLEKIIAASSHMFEIQSLRTFVSGVLTQLTSLLRFDDSSFLVEASGLALVNEGGRFKIVAATGEFADMVGKPAEEVLSEEEVSLLERADQEQASFFQGDNYVGCFLAPSGKENLLYLRGGKELSEMDKELVRIFASNVSVAFDNIYLNQEIEDTQKEVIITLGEVVENRSKETGGHVQRVGAFSALLAEKAGLPTETINLIRQASPMHDVGKIGIPEAIMNKPGPLNNDEFEIVKRHTSIGHDILKGSRRTILREAALIAQQHHERWDGHGYPHGLKGEEINVAGRIVAIADVFDALGSPRVYKKPWTLEKIINYFKEQKGHQFDPELTQIFLDNMDEFVRIRDKTPDSSNNKCPKP